MTIRLLLTRSDCNLHLQAWLFLGLQAQIDRRREGTGV